MKKSTKAVLLSSFICIGAGILLSGIGFACGGQPGIILTRKGVFSSSSRPEYTLHKTKIDSVSNVQIEINSMADIQILPSEDDHFYLEYKLDGNSDRPSYEVTDGTLHLTQDGSSTQIIGLDFGILGRNDNTGYYCSLYIPEGTFLQTLNISGDSGDLSLESLSVDSAEIFLGFGDLDMKDSSFKDLTLKLDSGDLSGKAVTADTLHLTNSFGNSNLQAFTGKDVTVNMDSGDFSMEAAALRSFSGVNSFGNMTLSIPAPLDIYAFDLGTEFGSVSLPENAPESFRSEDDVFEDYYKTEGTGDKKIEITAESGDIKIREY